MSKIYERNLTVANGEAIAASTGMDILCETIGFPPEAVIKKVVARQASGTPVGFTVDLFNRPVCSSNSSSSPSDTAEDTAALAKIMPSMHADAGNVAEMFDTSGYLFRNMVGDYTIPVKAIYLRFVFDQPTADESTWEISIGCLPESYG